MTLDLSNTDKLSEFRREAQRLGFRVEPPSVNRSGVTFEVHADADGQLSIRYALAAIKGCGQQAVESLVAARGSHPFKDLSDLARRINPRLVNKKTLESLIAAGALDELEKDRARAFAAVDQILAIANRSQEEASAGQGDIFGSMGEKETLRIPTHKPRLASERLQREYDAIGFFLSGHPLDDYATILKRLRLQTYTELARAARAGTPAGRIAATVLDRTERRTKSGSKMGILALSDRTGHFEAIIFQEGLNHYRDILEPGHAVILTVQAQVEGDDVRLRINGAEPLEKAAAKLPSALRVTIGDEKALPAVANALKTKGDGEISLIIPVEGGVREVEMKLSGRFQATPQVAGLLRTLPGVLAVEQA